MIVVYSWSFSSESSDGNEENRRAGKTEEGITESEDLLHKMRRSFIFYTKQK